MEGAMKLLKNWLKGVSRWLAPNQSNLPTKRHRNKVSLSLEVLEDRLAPAAFTVDRLGDVGNGAGNSGDLRYVITQLNA